VGTSTATSTKRGTTTTASADQSTSTSTHGGTTGSPSTATATSTSTNDTSLGDDVGPGSVHQGCQVGTSGTDGNGWVSMLGMVAVAFGLRRNRKS
jgi:MYXO-CTERM domain-containing protein